VPDEFPGRRDVSPVRARFHNNFLRGSTLAARQREEVLAVETDVQHRILLHEPFALLGLVPGEVLEDGGEIVGVLNKTADAPALRHVLWVADDQRHANRRLVDGAVSPQTVEVQVLAVVAGDDDGRFVQEPQGLEFVSHNSNAMVGVEYFVVVQIDAQAFASCRQLPGASPAGDVLVPIRRLPRDQVAFRFVESAAERLGHVVRRVGVPVVHEEEEVLVRVPVEPRQETLVYLVGDHVVVEPRRRSGDIDVKLEPAHELLHVGAKVDQVVEGCGRVSAARLDQFRKRGDAVVEQRLVGHIPRREIEAMINRGQAGEQARERRSRGNRRGIRVLEKHALGCQPVDVRAGVAKVTVTAQVIGSESVEDEPEDVHCRSSAQYGGGWSPKDYGSNRGAS